MRLTIPKIAKEENTDLITPTNSGENFTDEPIRMSNHYGFYQNQDKIIVQNVDQS